MVRPVLDATPRAAHNAPHMNLHRHPKRHGAAGFTLIELMVAVVVVGILLSVALPSFLDSMRKGRRSEAVAALAAIQQAQERWRSNNVNYSNSVATELKVTSPTKPGGYYTLAVSDNTATGYVATADGSASSQANDGQCAKLAVRMTGGAVEYASCATCALTSLTFAATDRCWSR